MINAIDIYNEVTQYAKKSGRHGFLSKRAFNALTTSIENALMSYYCDYQLEDSKTRESLRPFIKEVPLTLSNGLMTLPSDYRKIDDLVYIYTQNAACGEDATVSEIPCDPIDSDEWYETKRSPIRKPDLAKGKVGYRMINSNLELTEKSGSVKLVYVAKPTYANIAFTLNAGTSEEEYNATGTINFQWLDKDRENLVDLFCARFGKIIRDPNLAAWIQKTPIDNQ